MTAFGIFIVDSVFLITDRVLKYQGLVSGDIVCNEGISFGIPFKKGILLILVAFFLVFLVLEIRKSIQEKRILALFGLSILCVGAFSNGIDRLVYGCVVDYIHIIKYFPWFNVADIGIVGGGGIVLIDYYRNTKK